MAIEESVILYLDFDRGDYHKENTGHLNPKLAKLMGVANSSAAPGGDDDMDIIYDDDSMSEDDEFDDDEMIDREDDLDLAEEDESAFTQTETASDTVDPPDAQKLLPLSSGREMDFMLSAALTPSKKRLAQIGSGPSLKGKQSSSKKAVSVVKKQNTLSVEDAVAGMGMDAGSGGHKKQKSNLMNIGRYRSKRQLNDAGRNDWELALTPEALPGGLSKEQIKSKWSVKEGFEVIKYILAEHEGLWDHVKDFHVDNVQKSVMQQRCVVYGL